MLNATTLLVSRDPSLVEAVREVIDSIAGFRLAVISDIETACDQILDHDEVLVTLVHLDDRTNVAGLTRILQTSALARRPIVTIVINDHENPEQALTLSRLGVTECLGRPLDLGRLSYLIDSMTIEARYGQQRAMARAADPGPVLSLGDESPFLYVADGRMGRMIEQIKRIAALETTVMLGGETGTGKTHLAGSIHRLSPRREKPFVAINCGALAANLIESEMFGHVRGAFTGADAERTGKFAAAGRGTLFLDEIDSLSLELQSKLLRVVEERAFEPVGSNKTLRLQARLIVASNRPLEREVAAGRFRTDLFYRLNVVAFDVPPLRERMQIVPALARTMLAELSARNGCRIDGISPEAMQSLLGYSWPGNTRELRNVIERAVALAPGPVIGLDDLPEFFHTLAQAESPSLVIAATPAGAPAVAARDKLAAPGPLSAAIPLVVHSPARAEQAPLADVDVHAPARRSTLAESKDHAERTRITQALERNRHNCLRAAAELGISRMTLYKKLHKYGLMRA
jgi:two-component system response regulator HydG